MKSDVVAVQLTRAEIIIAYVVNLEGSRII